MRRTIGSAPLSISLHFDTLFLRFCTVLQISSNIYKETFSNTPLNFISFLISNKKNVFLFNFLIDSF